MNIRQTSIAPGNQGTRETLRLMAGLVREAVQHPPFGIVVHEQFGGLIPAEVDLIVRRNFTYTDEQVETLYHPAFNMTRFLNGADIIGDCDDVSMFLAAVFTVLGYPSRFVAMRTRRNDPDFLHVVTEVFYGDSWRRFDPTVIAGLVQVDYGSMIETI